MTNNIRASGNPFSKEYKEGNIFKISEVINNMIKVLRHYKIKKNEKVLAVIDSFRNHYDVTFGWKPIFCNKKSVICIFNSLAYSLRIPKAS